LRRAKPSHREGFADACLAPNKVGRGVAKMRRLARFTVQGR
jgi:hypothetical protein